MNNNEKKVDDALSDIFDTDFLEINVDNEKKDFNLDGNKTSLEESKIKLNDDKKTDNFTYNVYEDKTSINDEFIKTQESKIEIDNSKTNLEENNIKIEQEDLLHTEKTSSKNNNKKLLIFIIVGILIGIVVVFYIVKTFLNVEKKTYCSYEASDTGFKLTDEYVITHKGNKITYVEGTYVYTALNDEFKSQIEIIKNEKLPVIVNSNGMAGFTHIFEESENYIKISSYYDTMLFDFSIVDKNDDKLKPISYINLKSDVTYKKLQQSLQEDGYKCTVSK